ncbi:MAG: UvrD-helicase domain-containing protein [Patescibacteria group bacterium]
MSSYTQGLNDAQSAAVRQTEGPLLILAGAGSGKTKTLTHRIAHILSEGLATEHQILAVTFTNKAAREMRERIHELLHGTPESGRSFMPFMGTFHGICVRILRRDGVAIGIDSNFVIIDESDRLQLIKRIQKELHIDEKQFTPRSIAGIISSSKNELIGPEEYASINQGTLQQKVAEIYPRYERALKEQNSLDFDDLLLRTVELFNNDEVLASWVERFRYIMVDEYQDTNAVQYKLIKQITRTNKNLAVVGDDWQSIYSWRGADYRNILNFERDFPDAMVIKLEQNYRSTKNILDAADAVIAKNSSRTDKKLWTDIGAGSKVKVVQVASERSEAEAIVRRITSHVELGSRTYSDFAVLYRTNAQSRSIEEQFVRYGVPYRIFGGVRFYDRKEVKDIMAYLRLIYQPEDRVSFERIINTPSRGIGTKSVENFYAWMATEGLSLSGALDRINEIESITARAKNSFVKFADTISTMRAQAEDQNVSVLVDLLIKRINYLDFVDDGTLQGESRAENVRELISVAREYDDLGLAGFLEEVALVSSADDADGEANSVSLMTLHAAKGLEFPHVFMVGMEEGIFPHSRASYDASEMEEERRLCYVGMTRAMQDLTLVYASSRMLYGSQTYNPPSRFIADIPSSAIDMSGAAPEVASSRSLNFGEEPWDITTPVQKDEPRVVIELQPGDTVAHKVFGEGSVLEVDGDNVAVYFKKKGVKKLNTSFAPLEKL